MVESNDKPMSPWDLYFAGFAAMLLHPGYTREGTERPTLEDCADLADLMVEIRNRSR